jgi:hypothetical protein
MRELARLIDVYRVHREPEEPFGDFCHRMSVARLHELAESQNGDRGTCATFPGLLPTRRWRRPRLGSLNEEFAEYHGASKQRTVSESGNVMRKF